MVGFVMLSSIVIKLHSKDGDPDSVISRTTPIGKTTIKLFVELILESLFCKYKIIIIVHTCNAHLC